MLMVLNYLNGITILLKVYKVILQIANRKLGYKEQFIFRRSQRNIIQELIKVLVKKIEKIIIATY